MDQRQRLLRGLLRRKALTMERNLFGFVVVKLWFASCYLHAFYLYQVLTFAGRRFFTG